MKTAAAGTARERRDLYDARITLRVLSAAGHGFVESARDRRICMKRYKNCAEPMMRLACPCQGRDGFNFKKFSPPVRSGVVPGKSLAGASCQMPPDGRTVLRLQALQIEGRSGRGSTALALLRIWKWRWGEGGFVMLCPTEARTCPAATRWPFLTRMFSMFA
jgi:hypothetical protein